MYVYARIGFSGNAAAYAIDNAEDECALLLSQLYGGKRVGCFSALAYGYDYVVFLDHRVRVSEF